MVWLPDNCSLLCLEIQHDVPVLKVERFCMTST